MKGSLRAKGQGAWELVFDINRDQLTNRRRQRSKMFQGTKREAFKELDETVLNEAIIRRFLKQGVKWIL